MRRHSIRFPILFALMAVSALLFATPAQAVAAKFFSATASVTSTGALTVSFDERGLGNGDIHYTLTADASAVYACINGGGKHPNAANKETVNGDVTAGGTFQSKNGRVTASLTADPIGAGGFTCPSGQRLVLASISYTNIVLADTTNGTATNVADISRTFFTV
jgi:hypothetical protein